MRYKITTYRTLTGTKEILEFSKRKTGQWIVYQNDKPTYLVDCFDFKEESNLIMNNLILSERKSIEPKELELQPLPEEWLS